MTIEEARKLLGKDAEGVEDEEILKEIETAELFKNLFFHTLKKPSGNSK